MIRTGAVLVLALLAFAPAASAYYQVTPLRIGADRGDAKVGDTVTFDVSPENDTMKEAWAGKQVRIAAAYDKGEAEANGRAPSEADIRHVVLGTITLDAKAAGTYAWTVAQEFDAHNVAIRIETSDGKVLAARDVAVGDAPALFRATSGPSGGGALHQDNLGESGGAEGDPKKSVPAVGALLAAGAAVAVAFLGRWTR